MKKSLLAFLGCLTLTAASLAGCSSSKPAETSAAPAETQAAAAEEELIAVGTVRFCVMAARRRKGSIRGKKRRGSREDGRACFATPLPPPTYSLVG